MTDRKAARSIQHRQTCSWRVYDAINRRTCLHIDAWLVQTEDDELYFVMETRIGGQTLMAQRIHRATPNGLIPVEARKVIDVNGSDFMKRHINSPWARRNYPWLADLHREHIQPQLHTPVEGFKGFRSIALHYAWSNPNIHNPFAGVRIFNAGGILRSNEGGPTDPAEFKAATKRKAPTWSRSDRSMLRTLDKIIKG